MTHAQLTEAVRARELLAPTPSERREECGHILFPGAECRADDSRRVAARVHAPGGEETGSDGCPPASTPGYQPHTCACGHPSGDHLSARTSWPHPPRPGLCLINGCDCRGFRTARTVPGTPRSM